MKNKYFLPLLLFLAVNVGCAASESDPATYSPEPVLGSTVSGTISYIEEEGGFYAVVTDEGITLDPTNLPEEFKVDGKRIKFTYEPRTDLTSAHNCGNIVDLSNVEEIVVSGESTNCAKICGVVTYIDLEGGFYGIVAEDGTHFLPLNLPAELQVDGKRIRFSYKVESGMVSIYMWGTIVTVSDVSEVK